MITNEPIFSSRESVDRFCLEIREKTGSAEDELGKSIMWSGLINGTVFVLVVTSLIVKAFDFLVRPFSENEEFALRCLVTLIGAVIVKAKYLDGAFDKRVENFRSLPLMPELKKPIGPFTLHALNDMIANVVQPGHPFRLLISSDGRLNFAPKILPTYGLLLLASLIGTLPGLVVYGLLQKALDLAR